MTFKDVSGKLPSYKCGSTVIRMVINFVLAVAMLYVSISLRMSSVGHLKEPVLPIR